MEQLTDYDLSVFLHVDADTPFLHEEGRVKEVFDGLREAVGIDKQAEEVDALALRVHRPEHRADLLDVRRGRILRLRLALLLHFLWARLGRNLLSCPTLRMLPYSVLHFQWPIPVVS